MATLSKIIKIKGTAIPSPAPEGWQVTLSDLDSAEGTGRSTADGKAFRDWIAEKTQIEARWNALTQSEISTIWNLVRGGQFFSVTYLDPGDGIVTKTFYVSDRKAACYTEDPDGDPDAVWTGLGFTFVEQ